jgi:hypothetical protein
MDHLTAGQGRGKSSPAWLEEESVARGNAAAQKRLRQACFPYAATIEQFDFRFRPELKRQVVLCGVLTTKHIRMGATASTFIRGLVRANDLPSQRSKRPPSPIRPSPLAVHLAA